MQNFLSVSDTQKETIRKNLFLIISIFGFTWIVFHFTVVFFFGLILDSLFLVGIFLGLGNFVALVVDIPMGLIQKYFEPKKILLFTGVLMLITGVIFFKFIYLASVEGLFGGFINGDGFIEAGLMGGISIFNSGINIALLLIAAMFYGLIKESFDVTVLSYMFNNSEPSEYARLISKYNISFGIGAFVGLLSAGIILAVDVSIAIFVLLGIILIFIFLINKYFDSDKKSLRLSDVKELRLTHITGTINKSKKYVTDTVKTTQLKDILDGGKLVFLKPIEIKEKINIKELAADTVKAFRSFARVCFRSPYNYALLWSFASIFLFGFWDTFVSVFQVEFLSKIIDLNQDSPLIEQTGKLITGYVLLGILVIPIFLSQGFFIKKSKTLGIFTIVSLGYVLSGVSMLFFGLSTSLTLIMIFGFINSFGYAAVMPISQAFFSETYNEEYAKEYKLKEIDSNTSAAPLKLLVNMANVVGLVMGSLIVVTVGFSGFFIVFGLTLIAFLVYSFIVKDKIEKEIGSINT